MGNWTRRRFLKATGAAGLVAVSASVTGGYTLWRAVDGELPPEGSPYVENPEKGTAMPREVPILLVENERGMPPTGAYLAEILRAEGLNAFQMSPLSAAREEFLERFPLVLLGAGPLDTTRAEGLRRYVARGGSLIAMRPPSHLADLFGVEPLAGQTAEGYLRILSEHPVGRGFPPEALQFHGPADHYRLAGAEEIARLATKNGDLPFPAVTIHRVGSGKAALWAFDLAWSVALTRQGNPAYANQERDGMHGLRAHELFEGWIDLDRVGIPQADEQMRLLSQLIAWMLADRLPLPRLWYFPAGAPGILIATGDAHNTPPDAVEEALRRVEQREGWFSVYYAPLPRNRAQRAWHRLLNWLERAAAHVVQPEHVRAWRERGHEFGIHPYVEEGLEAGWRRYWEAFTGMGYGPVPPTVRTHRVLWSGWVETARMQAKYGIRMNLDYYLVGPMFRKPDGDWAFGYFTGSGLPMRFVDEQGRLLAIYQQPTQLVDEQLIGWTWEGAPRFPPARAVEISRELLRGAAKGAWGAIGLQAHIDPFAIGGEAAIAQAAWLEGVLDAAVAYGLPIWSAHRWLQFVEARAGAIFQDLRWDPIARRLQFLILPGAAQEFEWEIGMPLAFQGLRLARVEVDGRPIVHRERPLRGIAYGWIALPMRPASVVGIYA
ncbi:MAG: twin-arginine translocation signal domain-containing protein [Anaerolineae bacterium]|nr:twin-arginine translocation signal domain-containing protein [Anaerolineae bacterium]